MYSKLSMSWKLSLLGYLVGALASMHLVLCLYQQPVIRGSKVVELGVSHRCMKGVTVYGASLPLTSPFQAFHTHTSPEIPLFGLQESGAESRSALLDDGL